MNRRLLLALTGVGAAGAGALWSQFHSGAPARVNPGATTGARGQVNQDKRSLADPAGAAASDSAPDMWAQRFERPEGGELVLAQLRGKPTVINFWATWCPPCVKEMPELDRFSQTFGTRGWQVVGIAVDSPAAVRAFLKRTPVSFPIGISGFGGTELARALGNPSGGLPFSVALDAGGTVVQRKLGATDYEELVRWTT